MRALPESEVLEMRVPGQWYYSTQADDRYLGDTETVKYVFFTSRQEWKAFEKRFFNEQYIKYHLPWGHSVLSDEQLTSYQDGTVPGIMYRSYSFKLNR